MVLTPVWARRAGWAEAFATGPDEMTDEDRQWLDAPLADSED